MERAYTISFDNSRPVTQLLFPDITQLGPSDRDYEQLRHQGGRRVLAEEWPRLELRSRFADDLSLGAFDAHFTGATRDSGGYLQRPNNLIGQGGPRLMHALRTYTTDVDVINYRLDVQEDIQRHPEILGALTTFHTQVQMAAKLHYEAYQRDYNKRRLRDDHGRFIYTDWWNLPRSYLVLDDAIREFSGALDAMDSQGMKDVRTFFRQVQAHEEYRCWAQNVELLQGGAQYVVGFTLNLRDGVSGVTELGMLPPGSQLEQLMAAVPNADRTITTGVDAPAILRRVQGLVSSDIGHIVQSALDFDFETLPDFCDALTSGMKEQFSLYATLGHVYSVYESLGIPICRPVVGEGKGMEMRGMVHPVVAWQETQKGSPYVLNDLVMGEQDNFLVITGPNDGGKSCYGKTWGFELISAQAGFMCPAQSVRIGRPVRDLYTHFASTDQIEKGQGRHRAELARARRICQAIGPQDALLFDEPCGGTDSKSGVDDSCALIDYAYAVRTATVFITHLHEISAQVQTGAWPHARNMQAEIVPDTDDTMTLTHRIRGGRAEHSHGNRISREEGVTPADLDDLLRARIEAGELDPSALRRRDNL